MEGLGTVFVLSISRGIRIMIALGPSNIILH